MSFLMLLCCEEKTVLQNVPLSLARYIEPSAAPHFTFHHYRTPPPQPFPCHPHTPKTKPTLLHCSPNISEVKSKPV